MAISVPTGPMPMPRIVMYPPASTDSPTKAVPPPRIALRQVKCLCNPVGVGTCNPVARATARSRSWCPVTMMIGSPMASSAIAPTNTQSGKPNPIINA